MKQKIVALVIRIASFFLRHRYIQSSFNKANLGCGLQCLSGWVNIDGSLTALFGSKQLKWLNKILYKLSGAAVYYTFEQYNQIITEAVLTFADLRSGIPLHKNSMQYIYSSHFLEHLHKSEGLKLLKECYRVLQPNGVLRISTPDLKKALDYYVTQNSEYMLDTFFYTAEQYDFSAHKYLYDFKLLEKILLTIGFTNVKQCSFQKGAVPDIEKLDNFPEYSLFVECTK